MSVAKLTGHPASTTQIPLELDALPETPAASSSQPPATQTPFEKSCDSCVAQENANSSVPPAKAAAAAAYHLLLLLFARALGRGGAMAESRHSRAPILPPYQPYSDG